MTTGLAIAIIAWTLYGEARGEGEYGINLCAATIYNRARREGKMLSEVCLARKQYSFWNTKRSPVAWIEQKRFPFDDEWAICQRIAKEMVYGRFSPMTQATHYHTKEIKPHWTRQMQFCTAAGNHVFWRGR